MKQYILYMLHTHYISIPYVNPQCMTKSTTYSIFFHISSANIEGNDFPPLALVLPLCPLGLGEMSFTATVLTE